MATFGSLWYTRPLSCAHDKLSGADTALRVSCFACAGGTVPPHSGSDSQHGIPTDAPSRRPGVRHCRNRLELRRNARRIGIICTRKMLGGTRRYCMFKFGLGVRADYVPFRRPLTQARKYPKASCDRRRCIFSPKTSAPQAHGGMI